MALLRPPDGGSGSMHNLSLHFARMGIPATRVSGSRIVEERTIWKFGYGPRYPRLLHPLPPSLPRGCRHPPGVRKLHAQGEFLNSFSRAVCARHSRYLRSCLSLPPPLPPSFRSCRDGSQIFNLWKQGRLNLTGLPVFFLLRYQV